MVARAYDCLAALIAAVGGERAEASRAAAVTGPHPAREAVRRGATTGPRPIAPAPSSRWAPSEPAARCTSPGR